jgi:hypothetical protein
MSKLNELVEWLEERVAKPENVVASVLLALIKSKARSLLAEEAAQKPAADLWGQHKQMIKLAQDNGLTLAANWAVNMSGRTFSEKPTKCEYINNKPECRRRCPSLCPANTDNDCNVGEKPTAHASLEEELRAWCNNDVCSCRYDIERILDGNLLTPTESIAEEPKSRSVIRYSAKVKGEERVVTGYFFKTPLTSENWEADHFGNGVVRFCIATEDGVAYEIDEETLTHEITEPEEWLCPDCGKKSGVYSEEEAARLARSYAPIAEEPMAVLARRKRVKLLETSWGSDGFHVYAQWPMGGSGECVIESELWSGLTIAAAEAKARKYLESLPDKGGK